MYFKIFLAKMKRCANQYPSLTFVEIFLKELPFAKIGFKDRQLMPYLMLKTCVRDESREKECKH